MNDPRAWYIGFWILALAPAYVLLFLIWRKL